MIRILGVCVLLVSFGQVCHPGAQADPIELPAHVHIVSIGIEKYPSGKGLTQTIPFCEADAIVLADSMGAVAKRGLVTVYTSVLLGEHATRNVIRDTMEAVIRRALPEDVLVFYFAGVSLVGRQSRFYLWPSRTHGDMRDSVHRNSAIGDNVRDSILRNECISGDLLKTWFARIAARNQLIILDAGPSSFDAFRSLYEGERSSPGKLSMRNIVLLSSYPYGVEYRQAGHGALTYCLLQGLAGRGCKKGGGALLSAWGLETYASRKCFELGDSLFMETRGASYIEGGDFNLGIAASDTLGLGELRASRSVQNLDQDAHSNPGIPYTKPRNFAVIFATNQYDNYKPLSNPIHDARTLAAELSNNYGFEIDTIMNPPRDTIEQRMDNCRQRTFADGDHLLIFVAGHGAYSDDTKQGFLIARDSKPITQDRFRRTWFKHTDLRDCIEAIKCKHILVILDVCFGGTFDRRIAESKYRSDDEYPEVVDEKYVERKSAYTSRWYLTSGGKEFVPDGRPGHHSPFAFKIIEALRDHVDKKKILTIAGLKSAVEKITPEPCMGEFGSCEPKGDFVFVPK